MIGSVSSTGDGVDQATMPGRLVSVNSGELCEVQWQGRTFTTGIFKTPVDGRRRVAGVQLDGDRQGAPDVHGGPTKSLYAYAREDYDWWSGQLGLTLEPGRFGENLTTTGLDLTGAVIGERWQVGSAVLRVTEPRIPCHRLGMRMGDPRFPSAFARAARPGAYLAIDTDGEIGAGDPVTTMARPKHGVTIGDVERAYHADADRLVDLLDVAELSTAWREFARTKLAARAAAQQRGRGGGGCVETLPDR